jgi:hypothetical protein
MPGATDRDEGDASPLPVSPPRRRRREAVPRARMMRFSLTEAEHAEVRAAASRAGRARAAFAAEATLAAARGTVITPDTALDDPRPGPRGLPPLPPARSRPAPAPSSSRAAAGRARYDDRPNTSRCSTASSARSRSSPASRSASRSRSLAFSSRSRAILRRQTPRQPRQPLIRLQRRRQHILQRPVSIRLRDHASPGNHGAQQTRP